MKKPPAPQNAEGLKNKETMPADSEEVSRASMSDTCIDLEFAGTDAGHISTLEAHLETDNPLPEEPPEMADRVQPSVLPATKRFEIPNSIEAEERLLSCLFVDAEYTLSLCDRARIARSMFYDQKHGVVFACALDLRNRGVPVDVATVAQELMRTKQLDGIGGYAFLMQVSQEQATTAQAPHWVRFVSDMAARRAMLRAFDVSREKLLDLSSDISELAPAIASEIGRVADSAHAELVSVEKPITDFAYPSGEDPNVLLGSDDYLGRGGGMLFISHAGAGKSSWILDASMSWALGEPWMGIRCRGRLKSLIIQAEDSDRYVGKVRYSFAHVHNLTEDATAVLRKNCIVVRLKGVFGPAFFVELRRLIAKHKPDLVTVNPIYLYAGGDISRAEFAQPFLVGLDELNREERFGYILVHHTGKPSAKDPKKGTRAELEDWETVYMGFGSSYLANWPRCSVLLEPRPAAKSRYLLKLGKGGMNAGVTREVQHQASKRLEPVTRIPICHSARRMVVDGIERPVIYWELDTENSEPNPDGPAPKKETAGRPPKYSLDQIVKALPRGEENRRSMAQILRGAMDISAIPRNSARDIIWRHINAGEIRQHEDGRIYV